MKKVYCIILFILPLLSFSQKVTLADLPGTEVGVILELKADKTFKEYYLFQYDDVIFDVTKATSITFLQATNSLIKITYDSKVITFTTDQSYHNSAEIIFYGYGISHKKANYTLSIPSNPIETLLESILFNNIVTGSITCHSGGEGSPECTVDSSELTGGGGCSVKCNPGYYACCDDTKNECRCIKITPKKPKKQGLHLSPN